MATSHSQNLNVAITIAGDETVVPAVVEYTFKPGTPDSWMEPGDQPEIEIQSVTLSINVFDRATTTYKTVDVEAPEWLLDLISNSDGVLGYLYSHTDSDPDPDVLLELSYDPAF